MTLPIDKVLDRVKKLLRLAEGTSNPNESAAAAGAAQKLITEYNLGVVKLDDDEGGPFFGARRADEPTARECFEITGKQRPTWEIRLLDGVCKANQCRFLWMGHGVATRTYTILGTVADRATVMYLFHYLRRQVEEVSARAVAARADTSIPGKVWGNNFRIGMVETISRRMMAEKVKITLAAPAAAFARGGEAAIIPVQEALTVLAALDQRVGEEHDAIIRRATAAGAVKDSAPRAYRGHQDARTQGRIAGQKVVLASGRGLGSGR